MVSYKEPSNSANRAAEASGLTFYPATRIRKRKVMPDDFPKRPLSAYNFFVKETRQKILANREKKLESSDLNMVKHISSLWRNIAPKERARIERMAEEDVLRYKNEVRAYEKKKGLPGKGRPPKKIKTQEEPVAVDLSSGTGSCESTEIVQKASKPESPVASEEKIVDKLEKLLAEEAKALQVARSSKFQQMKLVQQAQTADPQLASFLDASRQALGLSSLLQRSKTGETPSTTTGRIRQRGSTLPLTDDSTMLDMMPSTLPRSQASASFGRDRDAGRGSSINGRGGQSVSAALERKLDGLRREEARLRLVLSEREAWDLPRLSAFEMPCNDPIWPRERDSTIPCYPHDIALMKGLHRQTDIRLWDAKNNVF